MEIWIIEYKDMSDGYIDVEPFYFLSKEAADKYVEDCKKSDAEKNWDYHYFVHRVVPAKA